MVRILKLCGLAFVVGLSALAFTPYISLFGPNSEPITPATLGATTWYEPSRAYVTNGSIVVLSNLSSSGGMYNLTNDQAGSFWPNTQAGMNGFVSIRLGVPYLYNQRYQTTLHTQEVVLCAAFTNNAIAPGFDSFTSPVSNHLASFGGGLVSMKMGNNSSVAFSYFTSAANKFVVYNFLFCGQSGSKFYTNLVATTNAINLSDTNMSGLVLGDGQTGALLSMFTFVDRVLTDTERAAAYYYLTNRFGQMP